MAKRDDGLTTMAASAALIKLSQVDDNSSARDRRLASRVGYSMGWQHDAWAFYGVLGEIHYSSNYIGNVIGRLNWRIGWETENGEVVPAYDDDKRPIEGVDLDGLAAAQSALNGLVGLGGTHSEWARPLGTAIATVGEAYLVGYWVDSNDNPVDGQIVVGVDPLGVEVLEPNPEAVSIAWESFAPTEIEKGRGDDAITVQRGREGAKETLPNDVVLVRIWRRHPRWPDDPDSPMESLLGACEDLELLHRSVRASGLSRVHAGILLIPQEGLGTPLSQNALQMPGAAGSGPPPNPVVNEIIAGLITPVRDPDSASTLVPTVITTRAEHIDKWKHLELSRNVDPQQAVEREGLVRRIAQGLDMPPEVLLGLGDLTHWNAAAVSDDAWRHVEPTADLVAAGVTTGYLWPTITDDEMLPRAVARRFRIIHDPSNIMADPDMADAADEAFDRAAISFASYRAHRGFDESDAPDEAELEARKALGLLGSPAPATPDATAQGSDEPVTDPVTAAGEIDEDPRQIDEDDAVTFAREVGRLEVEFVSALTLAGEFAIDEATRKANSRLRSAVGRDPGSKHLRALIRGADVTDIARLLGPREVARIAAFANEDDEGDGVEALFEGALVALLLSYRSLIDATHRQWRSLLKRFFGIDLTEDEVDQMQADAAGGETTLEQSARMYGRERLFNRAVASDDDALGEVLAGIAFPPAIARRTALRAGGGHVSAGFGPIEHDEGGAVTSVRALEFLAFRGFRPNGIIWVYGSAPRTDPFPPHRRLDGSTYRDRRELREMTSSAAPWSGGFRPGDHRGCRCALAPIVRMDEPGGGSLMSSAAIGTVESEVHDALEG